MPPFVTQFIVKLANKEKLENVPFLKVYHYLLVKISKGKGVCRASSDSIIYFNIRKIGTKSLICQIMFVNKVPNFPSFFPDK